VVRRIVNGAVEDPIDAQESGVLIELVLHLRAPWDLDDGAEIGLDRVSELHVVPGMHDWLVPRASGARPGSVTTRRRSPARRRSCRRYGRWGRTPRRPPVNRA